tara:strand:- start:17357 stop:17809 length:453 start_codon:yes stop_codon:yes gene_type:complete
MGIINETYNSILDTSWTIECEDITIQDHKKWWIYYDDSDNIIVALWNDFHDDIEMVIDTSNFESFQDTRDLETFRDEWDYATESVYQVYSKMDWDDYIAEYGHDELIEHVSSEINAKGSKIYKRPLNQRIWRLMVEWKWEIKNYFKTILK